MKIIIGHYQIVWWWDEWLPLWGFRRFDPKETSWGLIFAWSWFCGPLEIRKWRS